MAPYTKADKNIRMKKILQIVLLSLTLFGLTAQAGTTTRTDIVWQEDCNLNANKTSIDELLFSEIYMYDAYEVEVNGVDPETNFAFDYGYIQSAPEEEDNTKNTIRIQGWNDTYAHLNFKYDKETTRDNWTLSFDYQTVEVLGFNKQICVTGTKAVYPSKTELTEGTFLTLNCVEEHTDDDGQYALYDIIIGGVPTGKQIKLFNTQYYTFKLKCTNADTNNATLTFICNNTEVSANINPETLGALNGIFLCFNTTQNAGMCVCKLDNFLLTTDVVVDDTPCSAPEYKITGAYNKARIIEFTCPTDGATIFWSENNIEAGTEGWTEYTEEVQTEAKTLYAYAYNPVNKTNSNVISIATGAGSKLKMYAKNIVLTDYVQDKGYTFTIIPDTSYYSFRPDYTVEYSLDGYNWIAMSKDDPQYFTPGSEISGRISATGFTSSSSLTISTAPRPQAPQIWEQDFSTLIDGTIYGTDKKDIVLSDKATFQVETKNIFGIKQFTSGSQNIDVSTDSRIGLTSAEYFTLQAANGIVSTKPELETVDGEEYDYLADADGLGINGVSNGQYIFITTKGGMSLPIAGCDAIEGTCTLNEQVYRANSAQALINIPEGVSIEKVTVCSNFEPVTTNEYGYAVHVSMNPLNFEGCGASRTYVIDSELRSGVFTTKDIQDVPKGEPFILYGTPNTLYEVKLGTSTVMSETSLLKVSDNNIKVSDYDKPIYTIDTTNGEIVMADKNVTITAGTPFILSELDAAEYFDIKLDNSGMAAIIYGKPLYFTGEDGLKAFIVTSESLQNGFEYTPISDIPAETGVIIKGNPGQEYHIQVGTKTEKITGNKLTGSSSKDFTTSSTDSLVYMLSPKDGNIALEMIDKNILSTIPAGTAYLKSKYKGFVEIHTNASGTASLTASQPLSFSETVLNPYIVTGETKEGITTQNITNIPTGTAFYVTGGKADTTYTVPVMTITETASNNILTSQNTDFNVSDTISYVYALNAATGKFERMPENYIIPAGEAFFISEFARIIDLGVEKIKTNNQGVATYITRKALDFSTVPLKAYIAISESATGTIEKMEIEQVPAGTPIFVKGAANTEYDVHVIAETSANVASNKLTGSLTEDFNVADQDYFVYVVKENSSDFEKAEPTYVIPAEQAYYISDKIGVERISTNKNGVTSWYSTYPLNFTSFDDLEVKIVTEETPDKIWTYSVKEVPADEAFIIRGTPNTTYIVPVGTCTSTGKRNMLRASHTESYTVNDAKEYVYAMSGTTGLLTKVKNGTVIKAGKAYFISKYMGYEDVTVGDYGYASHVCANPLDFETVTGLKAYIIYDETIDSISKRQVTIVPEGTAFYVTGEPGVTYKVPIRNTENIIFDTGDNLLEGSLTEDFNVDDSNTMVYAMSARTGQFTKVKAGTTIAAGKAYFRSKYIDFITIKTNEWGNTSYITQQPLDFSDRKDISVSIVVGESKDSIYTRYVKQVPAGEAILIRDGKPNYEYKVPIGTATNFDGGAVNLLRGDAEESFVVNSVAPYTVYAMNKETGMFNPVASDATIAAGKAYYVSKYTNSSTAAAKAISSTTFIEEEEATAIKEIEIGDMQKPTRFFNLAGQPVDDDYKGIVIDENGKKYKRQ